MNMQDVLSLTIAEGGVRTIHDKDNRLLWGKVNYDTEYKGDTTQQTYTGKNLINNSDTTYDYSNIGGQYITITSLPTGLSFENTYATGSPIVIFKVFDGTPYIGKTIRLKANFDTPDSVYRIIRMDSNAGNRSVSAVSYESGKEISYTIPDNLGSTNYFGFGFGSNAGATVNYTNLIMTIDDADMTYEPYVGGTASPNPVYPQAVNVVTGEQTITISDGTNSQNYTVGLGTIELCKIGTYQDYIYKSGDDWYVHKETGKSNLGDLAWFTAGTNVSGVYRMTSSSLQGTIKPATSSSTVGNVICSHFTPVSANNTYACVTGVAISTAGSVQPYSPDYNYSSSASDFKTWLTNNNVTLFYALATPTDTKITDTTLIGQLNAVHQWLTRYGYNATVSGNLPIIIDRTNL